MKSKKPCGTGIITPNEAKADLRRNAIPGVNLFDEVAEAHEKYAISAQEAITKIEALKQQYPRAAALKIAESYLYGFSYSRVCAASKAFKRILNGEDYETAIADMRKEFPHEDEA